MSTALLTALFVGVGLLAQTLLLGLFHVSVQLGTCGTT